MATPWLTSDDLVNAVKRKISFPVDQATFSEDDILAFANDEMMISQVPNVMEFHQEYFVRVEGILIKPNQSFYPVPNRAIGMKLRDLHYGDGNLTAQLPFGNLYEMTRIDPGDKAFFQETDSNYPGILKFYMEGNNVALIPTVGANVTGFIIFSYFFRPNQLVSNSRAFVVGGFSKTITVNNATAAAGDTITINGSVFTAVTGAAGANQFQIGATNTQTTTNLTASINNSGIAGANNGTPATNTTTVSYGIRNFPFSTSNSVAYVVQNTLGLTSSSPVPANITNGSIVDVMQTLPGHMTYSYDRVVPNNGINGNTLSMFEGDIPNNFLVGDYIASQNECIIPQIPPELHRGFVERICARILTAIGDMDGLNAVNAKIGEINQKEGELIDQRVDGAPQKLFNKRSFMRLNKINRRLY